MSFASMASFFQPLFLLSSILSSLFSSMPLIFRHFLRPKTFSLFLFNPTLSIGTAFCCLRPRTLHVRTLKSPLMAPESSSLRLVILFFFFLYCTDVSFAASPAEALLKFKDSIESDGAFATWNSSSSPCSHNEPNWSGVLCQKGKVWGLQLENLGLKGSIDIESLKELPDLRTLSFMNNDFDIVFPHINQLGALKSLYLSNNRFSGEIPGDAFSKMMSLKKVHLANNSFTGEIPWSLKGLHKLLELRLEDNQFSGKIPNFRQKTIHSFNVSNNYLHGRIPTVLSHMDPSSFSGDQELCGKPLSDCSSVKKHSILSIIILSAVIVIALAAIGVVIFILKRHNRRSPSIEAPPQKKSGPLQPNPAGKVSPDRSSGESGKKVENMKLSFVRETREKFDLQDLLGSSAEILGSGCFGSSYKAALQSGPVMVVKRFKQMNNVGRQEFQEHLMRIGRLSHPNLLPLVAYYYKKDEKLLISGYVENGSLAVQLHGQQEAKLDWEARLKIVKGVARGLQYLYNELPCLIAPHGHLKSSNVLITQSFEPVLTDYALIPIINQEHAQDSMAVYKSPEYSQYGRITKKTDVWCLGLLILEIMTGRFPANVVHQGKSASVEEDLAAMLRAIPQEEYWTREVFDKEMAAKKSSEGEMAKLLRIGLGCCEVEVEKRMDLKEAAERIQEVKEKDGDDNIYSSIGLSDDLEFGING